MDSMTEMFYDESNTILRNMRKGLLVGKETGWEGQEDVQEIFRGVHTLKADSAMMLYEYMADLSDDLESLLYCFRGEGKKVTDANRFEKLVGGYLDFFEQEIEKLAQGRVPDGTFSELEEEIKEFTAEMKAKMPENEVVKYQQEISKPRRQVFYIASANDEEMPQIEEVEEKLKVSESKEEKEETFAEEILPEGEENAKGKKRKYIVSENDRERVCESARELLHIIDNMEHSFGDADTGSVTREQLERLKYIQNDLAEVKKALVNTNFVPVAQKMTIVVDEMSERLGKPVKLVVKGEDTLVDSERRGGISGALIHLIRNAVDHGIEDMDTRERYGKSPMGLIKLRFSTEDGHLKVTVKDDGAGIDTERILEVAGQSGLLTKEPEEYTEREVYNLMLISGLSTKKKADEYSGRGVGMDVIRHNVAAMGGKLKITSKRGLGTTITMKF